MLNSNTCVPPPPPPTPHPCAVLSAQLLERGSLPEAPLMGIRAGGSEITLPPQVASMSDSDQGGVCLIRSICCTVSKWTTI